MNEDKSIKRPYPGFIIPQPRIADVGLPGAKVYMTGRFRLTVRSEAGVIVKQTPWFDSQPGSAK